MKFTCDRVHFIQAVSIAAKGLPSKTSTPILAGMYIKAEDSNIEIHTTDNETGIRIKLGIEEGVNIETSGYAIVVGRYFFEVIRNLPGDNVKIETNDDEQKIIISSGKLKYTLNLIATEDFPLVTSIENDIQISITDNVLRLMIQRTCFACETDASRPLFTGCAVDIQDNKIAMAATNTHQLAVQNCILKNSYNGKKSIIVPSKILIMIEKMLTSEIPTDVLISFNSRKISFTYENIFISSRLLEGKFPDYNRVIPLDFSTRVSMNTEEFASAMRRINVIASTSEYKAAQFQFSNSSLRISSQNPDIGYSEEIIPAEIDGEDISILFNSEYLLKAISVINTEKFTISLNSPISATAIRELEDLTYTYIITPIRSS